MPKLLKTLLLSATAASLIILALRWFDPSTAGCSSQRDGPYVDADKLTREEKKVLLDELATHL